MSSTQKPADVTAEQRIHWWWMVPDAWQWCY